MSNVEPTSTEVKAAKEMLHWAAKIVVKQNVDHTGADLREEVWAMQDAMEAGGFSVEDRISQGIADRSYPHPRSQTTELFDLVEAMLFGLAEDAQEGYASRCEAIMHYLRNGDLNALLHDDELLETLEIAVGAHERESRDIEQFYHFILFLKRYQFALGDGPLENGGTCDIIVPEPDDEDEDEDWELRDPLF